MATLLIGYDTESAAVGEGLARFIGPDVPQYRAALDPDTTRRGVALLAAPARGARGAVHVLRLRPHAAARARRDRAARRLAALRHPAAHLQPRRLPRRALPRRGRRAPRRCCPRRRHVALREELALHLGADPQVPRPRVHRPADAVRLLPRPARPARPARDRPRHRPPLRHLVGPQRAERQPDAVGAAVRLRRRGLPRPARDPVPVLARRRSGSTPTATARGARSGGRSRGAIDEVAEQDLVFATAFHEWVAVEADEEGTGLDPRADRARARARRRGHELRRLLGADNRRGAGPEAPQGTVRPVQAT